MHTLPQVAPAFVAMAHKIVWASATTVNAQGRPRSRILHPIWEWDGARLVGWIATSPTPVKRAHLDAHPTMVLNYWEPSQDTCAAECHAALMFDDATRIRVWNLFANAPAPVGYNPSIVPAWTSPTAAAFVALRLEPYRLRVFPGSLFARKGGEVFKWRAPAT